MVDESASQTSVVSEVVDKIKNANNILIALSSNPSVDEMAAAIGTSLFLDKLGKHATAIYSGATPNAIEFLNPEKTFEPTVDSLQDFVIALNKEKADHLRYKIDGDFVKIYITPYKGKIAEEDLDFSYGDYNIDLVLALDVANGVDLDAALREHGRIMHDAVIVNITNGNPGKLGEIEWSDKTASSVSEMLAKLIYSMNAEVQIESEEATAFLTGIVAATNRFSNTKTTPEAMQISSKLMASGANQQLVTKNITSNTENEMYNMTPDKKLDAEPLDQDKLEINHGNEKPSEEKINPIPEKEERIEKVEKVEETILPPVEEKIPEIKPEEATVPSIETEKPISEPQIPEEPITPELTEVKPTIEPREFEEPKEPEVPETKPMGKNPAELNSPDVPTNPEINGIPSINYMPLPGDEILAPPPTPPIDMSSPLPEAEPLPPISEPSNPPESSMSSGNPSAPIEPIVPATPPTEPITPATPPAEPTLNSLGDQPAMQDQVYNPQASDPGAFKIPGM